MCQINRIRQTGFSILELMVSLAVLAILAKLGIASYTSYIQRLNRELAKDKLRQSAVKMEQYYNQNGRYLTNGDSWPANYIESRVVGNSGIVYAISFAPSSITQSNAVTYRQSFMIIATPVAGTVQASDSAGNLCINQTGTITENAAANCGIATGPSIPHENCYDVMYSTGKFASNYGGYPLCDDAHYPGGCPVGIYYTCSAHCEGSIVLRDCSGYCNNVTIYCSFGNCSGFNCNTVTKLNCGGAGASSDC